MHFIKCLPLTLLSSPRRLYNLLVSKNVICILNEGRKIIYHDPGGVIFFGIVLTASGDDVPESDEDDIQTVSSLLHGYGIYRIMGNLHPWKWTLAP
jgi:hypothetical protein